MGQCNWADAVYCCHIYKKYASIAGYRGELCKGCKDWVNSEITPTGLVTYAIKQTHKYTFSFTNHKAINHQFRAKYFMFKFMLGFECHKNQQARVFVLTESDNALKEKLDLYLTFKHLIQYLRRKKYTLEYCWVKHRQGVESKIKRGLPVTEYDKVRVNIHVVFFGSYIPQQIIEDWWFKHYLSHRSKMELMHDAWGTAKYLAKYLHSDHFVGSYFSKEWVFPGWVGFSKFIKKEFDQYPDKNMMIDYKDKYDMGELKDDPFYALYQDSLRPDKGEEIETVDLSGCDRVQLSLTT